DGEHLALDEAVPRLGRGTTPAGGRAVIRLLAAGFAVCLVARELYRRANTIELEGRVVLITGGSRGLGFAIAKELVRHGASLSICARDEGELERARGVLAGMGAEVLALRCDVAEKAQVEETVRRTVAHFGRIDVLVNNAGIITV